jgi:hypothetical protein
MDMIAHMRNYQAVFEIPRGRTAILCMANQDEFDKLRKDYDNITKAREISALNFPSSCFIVFLSPKLDAR